MRTFFLTLASILSVVRGQQRPSTNVTYPDVLSLLSNQTSLTALWSSVQQYIEIADQFAHFTNVTIIAPNNDAIFKFTAEGSEFAQANNRTTLEAVMKYHIIQGQYPDINKLTFAPTFLAPTMFTNVTGGQVVGVDTANGNMTFLGGKGRKAITVADTLFYQGGVVHIIDQVMTIPVGITPTTSAFNLTSASGALNLTGLTTALGSTWDVTVFAPLDAGFGAIASAVANMTVDQVEDLMKYHIVAGSVIRSNRFNDSQLVTTQGQNLTLTTHSDGSIYVNNARIIQSDILLSNGVLHIIDNVLNPQNTSVVPTATTSGAVAFAGATANGTIPFMNVPAAGSVMTGPSLNSTIPTSSSTPAGAAASRSGISVAAIAGIAIGTAVLIAAVVAGTILYLRLKGYRVKVSRKSIAISSPRMVYAEQYELPPDGRVNGKVELPASVPIEYVKTKRSNQAMSSDSSTAKSDTTALLEKPPPPPAKDDVKLKKDSPISPLSSNENVFELSADQDVRARIERLLRPKNR